MTCLAFLAVLFLLSLLLLQVDRRLGLSCLVLVSCLFATLF